MEGVVGACAKAACKIAANVRQNAHAASVAQCLVKMLMHSCTEVGKMRRWGEKSARRHGGEGVVVCKRATTRVRQGQQRVGVGRVGWGRKQKVCRNGCFLEGSGACV